MKVDGVDIFGWAAALWATDSGQHGFDEFFSQDKQCREGSDARSPNPVTAAFVNAADQCFAS
jgi:hypothetical protein